MVNNPPANAGDARDAGSIPGSGRSPGVGNSNPTPVFLPGRFHGQRSRAAYNPWSSEELDATEQLNTNDMNATLHPRKSLSPPLIHSLISNASDGEGKELDRRQALCLSNQTLYLPICSACLQDFH